MPSDSSLNSHENLISAALLVLFGLGAVASVCVHSAVPDEAAVHVPAGFLFLETGVFAGGLANPPLGQVLVSLPIWLGAGDYVAFESDGLLAARLVVVVFGLLGGLALLGFARSLVAPAAALGALFFFTTSPNFIAHASVATLDVLITVAVLLSVAAARRCSQSGKPRDFAMLGASVGVACSIKFQGIAVIPLVFVQIALAPGSVWRSSGGLRRALTGSSVSLAIAWFVIHAAYGFVAISAGEWLPSALIDATWAKLAHGSSGHTGYLLGELSTTGSWLYFPVALAVKTPVPLLVCAAIGFATIARSRELAVWLGIPALLFFSMAVASSVNIGVRHLLPFFPFFFIAGGLGLFQIGQLSRPAAGVICAVQLFGVISIAPHFLGYFNVFGGGAADGYRVLLDSNFDWGQHEDQLRAYLEENPGAVEIAPDPLAAQSGRVVVGASVLHGILGPDHAYGWLREHQPTARIANTWFEYQLSESNIVDAPRVRAPRQMRVRRELVRHLLAAAREAELAGDVRAELAVAKACWALFEYQCALDYSRRASFTSPGNRSAFWLASELTARRRLGALRFEGREFLDGFEALEPAASLLSLDKLSHAVERLEPLGVRESLIEFHNVLGDLHARQREWTRAIAHLRRSHALDPDGFAVKYKLGWLLATHPDLAERDGVLALELALEHGEQAGWRVAAAYDLKAAALADLGRFEEALTSARRGLELASVPAQRASMEARIDLYAAGRPYRQPAAE